MADTPKVEIAIEASQKTGAIGATATELEKLQAGLKGAQDEARNTSESMKAVDEATEKLQSRVAEFVSAAALGRFFQEAVEESLKEEEALRTLRGAIESTGQSWAKYKDIIEEFGKVQQANTRFDDTSTFETLGKLARATKTVEQAMSATVLAQNLSVATNKSLVETTELVNGLLLGQSRAIVTATKEFGSYAGGATTAQQALDNLQKSVKGVAAAEESNTKVFQQSKAAIGDFAQRIGDGAMPVLRSLVAILAFVLKGTEKMAETIAGAAALTYTSINGYGAAAVNALSGHFANAKAIAARTSAELAEVAEASAKGLAEIDARYSGKGGDDKAEKEKLAAQQSIQDAEQAALKKAEIARALSEQVNAAVNTEQEVALQKIDAQIEAARAAGATEIEVMIEGHDQKVALAEAHDILVTQIAEQEAAKLGQIEEQKRNKAKMEADKRAAAEKLQNEKDKADLANFLNFVSTLSNAKSKELQAIGKAASIASATIKTYDAAQSSYAFGARIAGPPLGAIMAAIAVTAGLANVAAIAGVPLATGAVVEGTPGGTQATIGEAGRTEAVLPLESPRAMSQVGRAIAEAGGLGGGGGRTTINLYLVMPGLEAVRDPRVAREVLEILGETMATGDLPEARVAAVRIVDLAELNRTRSA